MQYDFITNDRNSYTYSSTDGYWVCFKFFSVTNDLQWICLLVSLELLHQNVSSLRTGPSTSDSCEPVARIFPTLPPVMTTAETLTPWKMANLQSKLPVPQPESRSLNLYQHSTGYTLPEVKLLNIRVCLFSFFSGCNPNLLPPDSILIYGLKISFKRLETVTSVPLCLHDR